MKPYAFLFLLLFPVAGVAAQDAVIISDSSVFELISPDSGVHTVCREVLVNNEKGLEAATIGIYTDSFNRLSSFSGSIKNGGMIRKVRKEDLATVSLTDGLADDAYYTSYIPSSGYPFTFEYKYSVSNRNGVASFPLHFPVSFEGVSVMESTFRLVVPSGFAVQYCSPVDPVLTKGKRDVYEWRFTMPEAIRPEHQMPPLRDLVPFVYSSPILFSFAGRNGSQQSWKDVGEWLYSLHPDSPGLSPGFVDELRRITSGCVTTYQKVSAVYEYIRHNTRYVSIQLGIGGLKPMPAGMVERTGFGDCKALSYYMRSALSAIGIGSIYFVLNDNRPDVLPGYSSIGQMNHAMLAVPLPENRDTLWIECTNPSFPLGYRHEGVAGHEVLLVTENGGKLVRVPAYPSGMTLNAERTAIELHPDGSAMLNSERHLRLDEVEMYLDFAMAKPDRQERILAGGWKQHPDNFRIDGIRNNFEGSVYRGHNWCPEMWISYSAESYTFAKSDDAGRLFVPMNPVSRALPSQRKERVYDIHVEYERCVSDTVVFTIPENYVIESLPDAVSENLGWCDFSSSAIPGDDGRTISVIQTFRLRPCTVPKKEYPAYRAFARKVNRAYEGVIVLAYSSPS